MAAPSDTCGGCWNDADDCTCPKANHGFVVVTSTRGGQVVKSLKAQKVEPMTDDKAIEKYQEAKEAVALSRSRVAQAQAGLEHAVSELVKATKALAASLPSRVEEKDGNG